MRFKDKFVNVCRLGHYRRNTELSYWDWARRFIKHTGCKSEADMLDDRDGKVVEFLTVQARRNVSVSTHRQALNALNFLYAVVLRQPFGKLPELELPKRPVRLPSVPATHGDTMRVVNAIPGRMGLIARLLYGTAMRISDALRLRLQELDFAHNEILIRSSKGDKDRRVPMPKALREELFALVTQREAEHLAEKRAGRGWVWLPGCYGIKNPKAHFQTAWQYLFAADRESEDPDSRNRGRHHLTPEAVQTAFRVACAKLRLRRNITPHGLRHAAARELERRGTPLASIQALLGHDDVNTTLRYLGAGARIPAATSPLDPA